MARPLTHAEYLASLVPPSVVGTSMSRRLLLKRALGASAAIGLGGSLFSCGDDDDTATTDTTVAGGTETSGAGSTPAASGSVTLGSNASDEVPKRVLQAIVDSFTASSGVDVSINTIEHETFQENISNYLQGNPDDVFTWFAGYRMQFFAERGLAGDCSSIWPNLTGFTDAFKAASTGADGKQYFVPMSYYPWAMFYRKSVWEEGGYEVPTTFDELTTLSQQMQTDGLTPIAFADIDGWPAMGTFDVLNMRVNGYDFHISLMAGKESWESAEVKAVFDVWKGFLPYHQPDSLGRTWQEAAQSFQRKECGMYLLGLFVSQQFPEEDLADLDFFNFPEIDSNIGATALDAPIDGMMMSKDPENEEAALAMLAYFGSAEAGTIINTTDPGAIAANSGADTSGFTDLKNRAVELVTSAESIAQFLDRDTRPDFASTVIIPSLQEFIRNPDDIDSLMSSIESQKKAIFVD